MTSSIHRQPERAFPTRLVVAAVVVVSVCLATTALFTFTTLLRLRTQYLSNRGREIASAIDAQARGPGRRNNAEVWQTLLEDSYPFYRDAVAYFAVVDELGSQLAHVGEAPSGHDVFVFELPLVASGRGPHAGAALIEGWSFRVGLYTSGADFIWRQAVVHLTVSAVGVGALILLAIYLLRTLRRFLDLKKREQAEQHLRALGAMAATLAHEIRNPLGAMKGLTQLAQEELPADHLAQSGMRTVVSEAERLERLVTDLLDFAGPKKSDIREFDVTQLVSDIGSMFQQKFADTNITLQCRVPPALMARSDPDGLRQVLLNVLSNSADAMPAGGTVVISARRDGRHQPLLLEVEDSGEGIGDRDPEELFQPFVTGKTRGTGLGLAVSRRIVEALGGSMTLSNGPVKGAHCTIRLPDLEPVEKAGESSRNSSRGRR